MKPLALLAALLLPLAAPAEDKKPAEWKGTVGAGLIILTGNSDTTTFTGAAAASRETFGWILAAKAAGAYGRSRPPDGTPAATTALNGAFQLRADRKFGPVWSVYALGGVEFDHVASVEYRSLAELGASALWLDLKEGDWQRLALRTDLGLRYGYEARRVYYANPSATPPVLEGPLPGVEIIAPHLGVAFRYGFSKEVFFTEDAEVLPTVNAGGRVLLKSVSKLSARLTQAVTFGVGYTVLHDTDPAPGKEKTDTVLSAMLEVGF